MTAATASAATTGKRPYVGQFADGTWSVTVWDHEVVVNSAGQIVQRWVFPCRDLDRAFAFEAEARAYAAAVAA